MSLTDQVSGMRRGVHARIGTLKSEGSKGGVQEGGVQEIRLDIVEYMGGCQNYGPFLDPYYNTAPNI